MQTEFRGLTKDGKRIYGMPTCDFKYIFNSKQTDSPDNYEVDPETVTQFTGLKLKGQKLYTKDVIQFRYKDNMEPTGYGYCTGVIEFENGAFVVKEIGFKHYDWENESQRPDLLYDWLKDNRCKYIGNILENPKLETKSLQPTEL